MNEFKKAQVVMLPTKHRSSFGLIKEVTKLHYYTNGENPHDIKDNLAIPQHLYITSDDEIKEGDWYYNLRLKQIFQAIINSGYSKKTDDYKVIATTDTSLFNKIQVNVKHTDSIKFYLPRPSQQFIEKYIEFYNKGESITDVLVEYEPFVMTGGYSIIKDDIVDNKENWFYEPKINSKDNTITIKKLKDSWNKKEIINLLKSLKNNIEN